MHIYWLLQSFLFYRCIFQDYTLDSGLMSSVAISSGFITDALHPENMRRTQQRETFPGNVTVSYDESTTCLLHQIWFPFVFIIICIHKYFNNFWVVFFETNFFKDIKEKGNFVILKWDKSSSVAHVQLVKYQNLLKHVILYKECYDTHENRKAGNSDMTLKSNSAKRLMHLLTCNKMVIRYHFITGGLTIITGCCSNL